MAVVSVDLAAIGWDLPAQELQAMARREGESPKVFAREVSRAVYEAHREQRKPMPYGMGAIRRAIEARMEEK